MKRPPTHGGSRPGAGRKPGSGPFGEPTSVLRIPQSCIAAVRTYLDQCRLDRRAHLPAANDELLLPLIGRVAAGAPIDADAHVEREIAIDRFLFRPRPDYLLRVHGHSMRDAHVEREIAIDRFLFRPRPDYLLRVHGHSMRDAGIFDRDLIAVHRTPEARNGQIVVARLDGEITVKRLSRQRNRLVLLPENQDFEPIEVQADDFAIEGIYVGTIRIA